MEKLALISVSDKTGIVEFAKELTRHHGYKILSTGGTAKLLAEKGIPVTEVSDYTGFPEMMDGRVKTLHPKIHGGLLCLRSSEEHMKQAAEHGISMIDLVVVNLYPFEATVAKPGCTIADAIENIDIGGPSMLRSAAKNHASVTVVCDNRDYPSVIEAMRKGGDELQSLRRKLALKVYQRTSAYDAAISNYLNKKFNGEDALPETLNVGLPLVQKMRYGENPHQQAALYGDFGKFFRQLHGKELSYNNIIDMDKAIDIVMDFERPTAVVMKHTNPCGLASDDTIAKAFRTAYDVDPLSAFGCVIALNRTCDVETAKMIHEYFVEVVVAPDFELGALEVLKLKKNIRLVETGMPMGPQYRVREMKTKRTQGGLLVQTDEDVPIDPKNLKVVTKRAPTEEEIHSLLFAWKLAKHVMSNAVVYVRGEHAVGIGAGQMSRVDSAKIASFKANEPTQGCVMASDAFFPFRDAVDAAAQAGITAIIQPGGSIRDQESIDAANEANIAMVFTGCRVFRHS